MKEVTAANYTIFLLCFLAILFASYTDFRRHIIPLYVFPPVFLLSLLERLWFVDNILESILGFCVALIASLAASAFGMGGGDVIMFSTIAFIIGSRRVIPFFFLMSILVLLYAFYKKGMKRKRGKLVLPLAPFCILPYLLVVFLY